MTRSQPLVLLAAGAAAALLVLALAPAPAAADLPNRNNIWGTLVPWHPAVGRKLKFVLRFTNYGFDNRTSPAVPVRLWWNRSDELPPIACDEPDWDWEGELPAVRVGKDAAVTAVLKRVPSTGLSTAWVAVDPRCDGGVSSEGEVVAWGAQYRAMETAQPVLKLAGFKTTPEYPVAGRPFKVHLDFYNDGVVTFEGGREGKGGVRVLWDWTGGQGNTEDLCVTTDAPNATVDIPRVPRATTDQVRFYEATLRDVVVDAPGEKTAHLAVERECWRVMPPYLEDLNGVTNVFPFTVTRDALPSFALHSTKFTGTEPKEPAVRDWD